MDEKTDIVVKCFNIKDDFIDRPAEAMANWIQTGIDEGWDIEKFAGAGGHKDTNGESISTFCVIMSDNKK